ncbi:hypothetical protein VP01_1339g1 [Puccinia sorghi]|uniref:Uncharacterized protein n=1 Tax=Puccinia sorghi TaxID=27349 RepID=A0A0L6VMW3_9BASI|nr:hypothetical protein VP01_1339g1 [Puccinia sorghi]
MICNSVINLLGYKCVYPMFEGGSLEWKSEHIASLFGVINHFEIQKLWELEISIKKFNKKKFAIQRFCALIKNSLLVFNNVLMIQFSTLITIDIMLTLSFNTHNYYILPSIFLEEGSHTNIIHGLLFGKVELKKYTQTPVSRPQEKSLLKFSKIIHQSKENRLKLNSVFNMSFFFIFFFFSFILIFLLFHINGIVGPKMPEFQFGALGFMSSRSQPNLITPNKSNFYLQYDNFFFFSYLSTYSLTNVHLEASNVGQASFALGQPLDFLLFFSLSFFNYYQISIIFEFKNDKSVNLHMNSGINSEIRQNDPLVFHSLQYFMLPIPILIFSQKIYSRTPRKPKNVLFYYFISVYYEIIELQPKLREIWLKLLLFWRHSFVCSHCALEFFQELGTRLDLCGVSIPHFAPRNSSTRNFYLVTLLKTTICLMNYLKLNHHKCSSTRHKILHSLSIPYTEKSNKNHSEHTQKTHHALSFKNKMKILINSYHYSKYFQNIFKHLYFDLNLKVQYLNSIDLSSQQINYMDQFFALLQKLLFNVMLSSRPISVLVKLYRFVQDIFIGCVTIFHKVYVILHIGLENFICNIPPKPGNSVITHRVWQLACIQVNKSYKRCLGNARGECVFSGNYKESSFTVMKSIMVLGVPIIINSDNDILYPPQALMISCIFYWFSKNMCTRTEMSHLELKFFSHWGFISLFNVGHFYACFFQYLFFLAENYISACYTSGYRKWDIGKLALQQKIDQLNEVDMQHAPAKLPSKLHMFLIESILEHGWSNKRSFLGLSACQLKAVEIFFFAVTQSSLTKDSPLFLPPTLSLSMSYSLPYLKKNPKPKYWPLAPETRKLREILILT